MATRNDLLTAKANATLKGLKITEGSENFIGFSKSKYVFYWFRIYTAQSGEVWLTFDHIYSQTNGRSSRSRKRRWDMQKSLGI